jgi:hypothetical protein
MRLLVVQKMIRALVFSKDRAMQLEGCLSSLLRHASGTVSLKLQVIYDGSSPRFLRQYDELARSFAEKAEFVQEIRFRNSVLEALHNAGNGKGIHPSTWTSGRRKDGSAASAAVAACVLFLVDDTIFVRPFDLAALQSALVGNPSAIGVSLRLGRNTTETYAMSRPQAVPKFQAVEKDLLLYEWTTADGDFGYPLELSSSMYRLADMLPTLRRLDFHDPNTLESNLALQAKKFARKLPSMLCPEVSIAFSVPVNRVQEVFENRSGTDPRWSTGTLADKFALGMRINVSKMDGLTPSACHQEMELPIETRA